MSSSKKATVPSAAKTPSKRDISGTAVERDSNGVETESDLKKLFRAKLSNVSTTRTIRTGSASLPTVLCEGIICHVKETRVAGREAGTTVPKLELTIDVHKLRPSGAIDCIDSGVPGFAWLLPTKRPPKAETTQARDAADDSPEAKGKAGKAKKDEAATPPRALCLSEGHKTLWLGNLLRLSLYTTSGKGERKEGTELLKVGMPVEVQGAVANLSPDSQFLYLNASNASPKLDAITTATAPEIMASWLLKPDVMAHQAIKLSMCARGFFDVKLTPDKEVQAAYFRDKWQAITSGTIAACDAKAMAIRAEHGPDGEPAASVMDNNAIRLKEIAPADFAFGAPFFNGTMAVSPDRPAFTASIVHSIASMEFPQHALISDLLDQEPEGPETFCVPSVNEIEMAGHVLLLVKCRLTFIGSRTKALACIKEGRDPTLETGKSAALGVKFNMRDLPKYTGVLNSAKAFVLCQDVLTYGSWSALVGVTPRDLNDDGVVCPFASGYTIDMPGTLKNIGILVDEDFVKKHLCDGDSNFVYTHDPSTPMLQDRDGNNLALGDGVAPTLTYTGYQEITGAAYAFKTKAPANKPVKQYRVWFEGATEQIKEDSELLTSSAAGVKAVASAATAVGLDIDDFFKHRAAIYVVAVAE